MRQLTKSASVIVLALLLTPTSSILPNYPTLQRCENHNLDPSLTHISVPPHLMSSEAHTTFRLKEKCATRLPHCLRPCPTPLLTQPLQLRQNNTAEDDETLFTPTHFTPHGYFRYDSYYFSPDDVCLWSLSDEQAVLKLCPPICSDPIPTLHPQICIPKCCTIHKALDIQSNSCEYINRTLPWVPMVYDRSHLCRAKQTSYKLNYVQTSPDCESFNKYLLRNVEGSTRVQFRLTDDGHVILRDVGAVEWNTLDVGTYCLDGVIDQHMYTGESVLLLCNDEASGWGSSNATNANTVSESRMTIAGIAYVVLLFLGVPFLFITALIYVLVWSSQNVHGWTLFSLTLAMLLHYLAQAFANIFSRIFDSSQNASWVCMSVGILNHYFVLASFCWMGFINYDLYSMFRHLKTTVGRSRGLRRFLVYMSVAWGVPLVTVLISVILDNLFGLYGDDLDCTQPQIVVPLYGHKTCYMTEEAMPFYLYYPVGVLMIINVILAFMTFRNMYAHDKSTQLPGENSRSTKHRRKFSVMAKLIVVMGLVYVFEIFVWYFKKPDETLPWYLVFPDVFNVLQAIAIFRLFACQDKVLGQVDEKYPKLRAITSFLRRMSCRGNKPVNTTTSVMSQTKTTSATANNNDKKTQDSKI